MTTITLPRATVEQALEALEAFLSDELRPYEAAKTSDALRAALAQQAEPVEPVAMKTHGAWDGLELLDGLPDGACLYTAPPQQAEAVNVAGPAHLAPKPAPGLEFDERGVLVPQQTEPVQGWTDADADAARLALELECLLTDKDVPLAAASRWWDSAHEALQLHRKRLADALAQQAEPVEPVAEVFVRRDGVSFAFWLKAPPPERTKLYTAPPQQAEPVAAERERCAEYLMQQAAECRENSPTRVTLESCAAVLRLGLVEWVAQQAEPVEPHRWEGDHNIESPFNACMHKHYCMTLKQAEQAEPVEPVAVTDHLARHGIQACLYPNCVGGQSGTVCHKHCPTPCPDCRGIGYDSSGQLCACQQNPSF